MTLLNHDELSAAMKRDPDKALFIAPLLDPRQIGPASIDLRLGTDFLFLRRTERAGLDPGSEGVHPERLVNYEQLSQAMGTPLWLHPGQFLLGSTLEFVRMPSDLAGLLVGRSSWARIGLVVEMAGLVQPGYAGTLTYELANMGDSPVALYPGLRIAQLAVFALGSEAGDDLPPGERYSPKYSAAVGPEPSRLAWEDAELKKLLEVGKALEGHARGPIGAVALESSAQMRSRSGARAKTKVRTTRPKAKPRTRS